MDIILQSDKVVHALTIKCRTSYLSTVDVHVTLSHMQIYSI